MRLQMTSEYAIRVLVYLGIHDGEIISAKKLNAELGIPYKYLTRLLSHLERSGFLTSTRGKNGGFQLKREQSSICLHEIINAIEGLEDYDRCMLGFKICSEEGECALHQYMTTVKKKLKTQVYSLTLEDLIKSKPDKI